MAKDANIKEKESCKKSSFSSEAGWDLEDDRGVFWKASGYVFADAGKEVQGEAWWHK